VHRPTQGARQRPIWCIRQGRCRARSSRSSQVRSGKRRLRNSRVARPRLALVKGPKCRARPCARSTWRTRR
ncbi:MAG: hypothetical protein ACK559_35930, partial [bacterium]